MIIYEVCLKTDGGIATMMQNRPQISQHLTETRVPPAPSAGEKKGPPHQSDDEPQPQKPRCLNPYPRPQAVKLQASHPGNRLKKPLTTVSIGASNPKAQAWWLAEWAVRLCGGIVRAHRAFSRRLGPRLCRT